MDSQTFEDQKIINVDIEKELSKSYLEYAMSVIVGRALPDVRDGLKPVHRRILYAMYEDGLTSDKPYRKSATTVGDVLGRYHPHGDAAVYDTMVRMAQDFSLRYPLIDGHGNFGSIDGDVPAAYRYTEARMSKIAAEMMTDIGKDTVPFIPNFDNQLKEPEVLPSRFPNLLVNGSMGIAVGMATNMPPHNLGETVDAITYLMDHEDASLEELMQFIKGPDFPTGGTIMGLSGIRAAYATGRGRIVVRGLARIEPWKHDRERIIISEIPYLVNKSRLVKSMADLVHDKIVEGISDIRDESGRDGMRIVIELKKDANSSVILNQLYSLTQLQDSFSVTNLALVDGEPKILTLRELLQEYIRFQEQVVIRRTRYDLARAEARAHILEGLRIAADNIDEVVRIIRASRSIPDAKAALIERFTLTQIQVDEIVKMTLGQLTGLEIEKIEKEYQEKLQQIAYFKSILADLNLVKGIIRDELGEIRRRYSDERRTGIETVFGEIDIEDLIEREDCIFTRTEHGYIKRQPSDAYRSQRRGGRGITAMATKEDDCIVDVFSASTHDILLFFTNRGRVFKLKGYQIPEAGRNAKGTNIVNLLEVEKDEKITAMHRITSFDQGGSLVMVTGNGVVKRTELSEYVNCRKAGLIAISLDEGDELVSVLLTDGGSEIVTCTRNGMSIRFCETDARCMGRQARGVKAMELDDGDRIVGSAVVDDAHQLLTVTENGLGKRTEFDSYSLQKRGGKGLINIRLTDKSGPVAGVQAVSDEDDVFFITSDGIIIRTPVADIPVYGRSAQGVILMRPEEGSVVVTVTATLHEEEEDEEPSEISDAENAPAEEEAAEPENN